MRLQMCLSFAFSHIADYYTELWRANEFSNSACFLAQDYHNLSSIDETLREIEGLACPSTLHHQAERHAHHAA